MQRIEQRQDEKGDCGVACIAMVTGRTYEDVESEFHKNGLVRDGEYYTSHKDLIAILDIFGYQVTRKKFTSWSNVLYPAIVKINVRAGNYWHWVVMAGERTILDPKPGAPAIVIDYRGRKGEGHIFIF